MNAPQFRRTIINHAPFGRYIEREFIVDGIGYICLEQYRVAEKARVLKREDIRQLVIKANDPIVYSALEDRMTDDGLWESQQTKILATGILYQLSQHKDMFDALRRTAHDELIEIGFQLLGRIYMSVRCVIIQYMLSPGDLINIIKESDM